MMVMWLVRLTRGAAPLTGEEEWNRLEPILGGAWIAGTAASPQLGLEIRDMWGRDEASWRDCAHDLPEQRQLRDGAFPRLGR
jgi:hypothetical protein